MFLQSGEVLDEKHDHWLDKWHSMFLIADSGSSKTEWRLINEEAEILLGIQTQGLNPYFVSQEKITEVLTRFVKPAIDKVERVFFYGAGCGQTVKADEVKRAIESAIQVQMSCEVAGDILGTARSLLQDKKGIACILGTGANSCVYDGKVITENIPSLGYILTDWGSGTVLGKDFLSLVLQEKLSTDITEDFFDTFQMRRPQILDSIYNKPLPNRFLATFCPFLLKYAEDPQCRFLITNNFKNFFEYYVHGYANNKYSPHVSFSGSVAFNFKMYLEEVAQKMGIVIDSIVQNPMDGLIKYHAVKIPML